MRVLLRGRRRHFRTVSFDAEANSVHLIDQRLLPHKFEILKTANHRETAAAIRDMAVRGAGAIAATAAFGLAQGVQAARSRSLGDFQRHVGKVFQILADARPTAVDPVNAMRRMLAAMAEGGDVAAQTKIALAAARRFADEDAEQCEAIGRVAADLIPDGARVLTHCNAGWLAFVDHGSATAPIYAAKAQGKRIHVYCSETRPRCQGAALTAWELAQEGVPHHVIADNAAGDLMRRGLVDLVIVGSDRTLGRTGEVANKIGTYTRAVLAQRHGIPFYVAIPLSTLDWNMASGDQIPIEERHPDEVLGATGLLRGGGGKLAYVRVANPGSPALNPGFDVTSPDLITQIITPVGCFAPQDLWANRSKLGFSGG